MAASQDPRETPLAGLLEEVLTRVDEVVDAQRRQALLVDAVVTLAADLSIESVLQRIVRTACEIVGCRYAALGMLGEGSDRRLAAFLHHGLGEQESRELGELPGGRGLLGHIIDFPEPVRISDIGGHPASYGFPPGHPPMRSFLGLPVRIRGMVVGNLYLTDKLGADAFTEEDEVVADALASAAGVVIENARLYAESARREGWLRAGSEASGTVFREGLTPGALRVVEEHAREAAGAETAFVMLDPEACGEQVMEPGRMVLPLRVGDEQLGALEILGASEPDHGIGAAGELARAQGFADQVAMAAALERSRSDRAQLAVYEDRDRIARDLHDLVIQRLFAVGLGLDSVAHLAVNPEVAERLASSVDDLDTTIKDIRRAIFALGDRGGDDLRHALHQIIERATGSLGFAPRLALEGPVNAVVTSTIRGHLLAVLQEGLSNAARHAAATEVTVTLVGDPQQVSLTVVDNGRGLPADRDESGLRNLRARADRLGGTFALEDRPGGGTMLTWQVPVEPQDDRPTGEDV